MNYIKDEKIRMPYKIDLNVKKIISLLFLLLCACSETISAKPKPVIINRANLSNLFESIQTANDLRQPLVFNSYGGMTSIALVLAWEINGKVDIIINDECISNCAELILPAAQKLYFHENPIIGFHGNISSYRSFVESRFKGNTSFCNWNYEERFQELLQTNKVNLHFWGEQMKRLNPKVTFEVRQGDCPKIQYNFENHMWLPTSEQLMKLFNLEFKGVVCADNPRKCKKRIDDRWAQGTRIVIGDIVYVSRGKR